MLLENSPPIGLIRISWKLSFNPALKKEFTSPPIGLIRISWKRVPEQLNKLSLYREDDSKVEAVDGSKIVSNPD